jgi:hypothetical protein
MADRDTGVWCTDMCVDDDLHSVDVSDVSQEVNGDVDEEEVDHSTTMSYVRIRHPQHNESLLRMLQLHFELPIRHVLQPRCRETMTTFVMPLLCLQWLWRAAVMRRRHRQLLLG